MVLIKIHSFTLKHGKQHIQNVQSPPDWCYHLTGQITQPMTRLRCSQVVYIKGKYGVPKPRMSIVLTIILGMHGNNKHCPNGRLTGCIYLRRKRAQSLFKHPKPTTNLDKKRAEDGQKEAKKNNKKY